MIHLEKIDYRNVWDIIKLKVTEPQEDFIIRVIMRNNPGR